jgi:S-adenosylmethionine:tRNA ribosyltransferase-isomerase
VRTADFDFTLSDALIAHEPSERRDQSRLLVLRRRDGQIEHRSFTDLLEYLNPGDALVLNNSRVVPARLRGFKPGSGGRVELLLLVEEHINDWWAMVRPGKRVRPGTK